LLIDISTKEAFLSKKHSNRAVSINYDVHYRSWQFKPTRKDSKLRINREQNEKDSLMLVLSNRYWD